MDKNDIIEYVMNTPHNTNRAVLSSMLNQLAEGEGGSSDFSTAEVTFVNSNQNIGYNAIFPVLYDQGEYPAISIEYWGIEGGNPHTASIPLYKGKCVLPVENAFSGVDIYAEPTLTGNISFVQGAIVIEGDGTITLAGTH